MLLPGPHRHAIAACRLLTGILSDMLVGSPQPVFVIEQTIERPELMLGLPFRSQTQFPLHFTDLHRSLLPCLHSASKQWKQLQAMGLPLVHSFPVLRVLRPYRHLSCRLFGPRASGVSQNVSLLVLPFPFPSRERLPMFSTVDSTGVG